MRTAVYPGKGNNLIYTTLALAGEAGEVADKVSKIIRDQNYKRSVTDTAEIIKELGDVLWTVAATAFELNIDLEAVACRNLDKLANRKRKNKLHGQGDNR
jgi:NTP pyrophosphatase (non-canonical NTP hydrolase)